jgi:hypothetical protein
MEKQKPKEFYYTGHDKDGNKIEDIGFLKFPNGTIEKFWEWYNNGKEIIVIQHRNKDKYGRFYKTEHRYPV